MDKEFRRWLFVFICLAMTATYLYSYGVIDRYVSPEKPLGMLFHWAYLIFMAYVFFFKVSLPIWRQIGRG